MRFRYSTNDPSQNEFDSLPRVPLILRREGQTVEAIGLVDSGATINVMPYELGLQLGAVWEDNRAIIQLAGNLSTQPAMPFFAMAQVGDIALIQLAFAWTRSPDVPLILGQTNFFMEFDVCFYRSKMEFEVKPKSP
ncbi:hypothetical protein DO97_19540 [Neosynechococcus sphagnicola sy1]|uniref:Peptidase A2 domain-containing protein n=1 Tax=Neosynechococcus sphagnicola sy1 TaxID=1497020 RepID=A0A098TH80_9CYAN|nr:hypothetical protein [Neosynechococcus sphagnicola]KGF71444.1 hypothetical protein DO97_19540 [Neosynechococcus sphagnicola sy1]